MKNVINRGLSVLFVAFLACIYTDVVRMLVGQGLTLGWSHFLTGVMTACLWQLLYESRT